MKNVCRCLTSLTMSSRSSDNDDSVIEKLLQRLNAAPNIRDACNKERELVNSFKEPQRRYVDAENMPGTEDRTAVEVLQRLDAMRLHEFSPRCVVADGNCMYRAMSLHLYGTEVYHRYIRLLTAFEMVDHQDAYGVDSVNYQHTIHDSVVHTPSFEELIKSAVCVGMYSDLMVKCTCTL